MFLIYANYSYGLEIVDKYLEEHRAFLDRYYDKNKMVFSGSRVPRTGGVIICKAETRSEVLEILSEDPFYKNKAVEYEIIEFNASKFMKGLESIL